MSREPGLWSKVMANAGARTGAVIILLVLLAAVLAPVIAPYDPDAIDLNYRLQPPSYAFLMGTDEVGRDIFSRVLWGARSSLSVGILIVLIGSFFGTVLGCFSGFLGGITDTIFMRLVDVVMAVPGLVLAMAMTAALGPSLVNAALALGILAIPYYARVARAQTLAEKHKPYINASQLMGAGLLHQLWVNILPNIRSPIMALMTLHIGTAILSASALSFIGLGAQPPASDWGALINSGRYYILEQWWYSLFPGAVMVLTVFAFNLLGDGLRDAIDPKGGVGSPYL